MTAGHAVILGVGPGLGQALALTYARAGYDLTLMARTAETLAPVAAQVRDLGRQVTAVPVDLGDLEAVDEVVTAAGAHVPISLLHHNVAMPGGSLLAAEPAELRTAVDVSALSAVVAVQAALPDLQQTGGTVAFTGGGIALRPMGQFGVLALGKSAQRAAGFALADELGPLGVRLRMLTVSGFIRPGGRFDPERIAEAFWAFVQSDGDEVDRIYDGRS